MRMQMSKLRYLQAASAPGHVVAQRVVREWRGLPLLCLGPKTIAHCASRFRQVCNVCAHYFSTGIFKIKPGPRYEPHTGLLCIKLC